MSRGEAESALARLGIAHDYLSKEEVSRFHLKTDPTVASPDLEGRMVGIVRDVHATATASTSLSVEVDIDTRGRVSAVRVSPQITAP